jgi:hypothetical protein
MPRMRRALPSAFRIAHPIAQSESSARRTGRRLRAPDPRARRRSEASEPSGLTDLRRRDPAMTGRSPRRAARGPTIAMIGPTIATSATSSERPSEAAVAVPSALETSRWPRMAIARGRA